jgi:iron complex transport system substrate-binding protein
MTGITRLRELGIKVLATEPRDLDDIGRWLKILGSVTGNVQPGEEAAARFDAEIADLRRRFGNAERVNLMIEIGQDPLMTLSGAHIVSSLVELCGATHLFAGLLPITPIVDMEAVYQANPDIILQLLDDETEPSCDVDTFWRQHDILAAVKETRVCGLPSSILSRHTTRLSEGARRLCVLIDEARDKNMAGGPGHSG